MCKGFSHFQAFCIYVVLAKLALRHCALDKGSLSIGRVKYLIKEMPYNHACSGQKKPDYL